MGTDIDISLRHRETAPVNHRPDQQRYAACRRMWQGCPTIARTAGGRLFAGWYSGGSAEPSLYNYNLLICSDDDGMSWSQILLTVDSLPEKSLQALDIELWLDPAGKLWLFWVQRDHKQLPVTSPGHLNTWAIVCNDPDAPTLCWSEPRFIAPGFLRCQPTVLSDRRWVLCAYNWSCQCYQYQESCDEGKSFHMCCGGKKVPTAFDESMIWERRSGELVMFARPDKNIGFTARSISTDGGKSWSDGELTGIPNPASRFYIRRLRSGRLLYLGNIHDRQRINMTAMLSEDDGATFPYRLLLDPRDTSYPDAVEGDDGTLYLIWDRGRCYFNEIVFARLSENDILAGEIKARNSVCGHIISKNLTPPPGCTAAEMDLWRTADSDLRSLLKNSAASAL